MVHQRVVFKAKRLGLGVLEATDMPQLFCEIPNGQTVRIRLFVALSKVESPADIKRDRQLFNLVLGPPLALHTRLATLLTALLDKKGVVFWGQGQRQFLAGAGDDLSSG